MLHPYPTTEIQSKMIRKSILFSLLALLSLTAFGKPIKLDHIQPAFWWAGMKHTQLQILLHGTDIGDAEVGLKANGVAIADIVRPENKNYILLYVETEGAKAQTFDILLTKNGETTRIPYELKTRSTQFRQTWGERDVVYLLMPDRFANGSKSNDVVKGMLEKTVDRSNPNARHGGDLAGIVQHLDYLADLGITAIWHTPTQTNDMPPFSYHGYAITNYYETDPRFGTNEDYAAFVAAAHQKGIKVIMDAVFNHCGTENFLYKDRPANDWFNFDSRYVQTNYKITAVSDPHHDYEDRNLAQSGWFVSAMPDWNQRQNDAMTYLIQNSIWWIEYAGIDGIRQDTYPYAFLEPMSDWCRAIETEYPGFNIVGETWLNSNVGVSYWQKNSKLSGTKNTLLPSVMDFPLMSILNNYFDEETLDWDKGLTRIYDYLAQDFVYADTHHLLTFLDNHDTSRFANNRERAEQIARYKQALTLLLTLRGQPQLYYGDEIGMFADKSQGDGALREDFPGGFPGDKANAFAEKGRTALQKEYFDFTRRLLRWRKTTDAVAGHFFHIAPKDGVYYYVREGATRKIAVIMNGTDKEKTIDLKKYEETDKVGTTAYEVISDTQVPLGTTLTLSPRGMAVFDLPCE